MTTDAFRAAAFGLAGFLAWNAAAGTPEPPGSTPPGPTPPAATSDEALTERVLAAQVEAYGFVHFGRNASFVRGGEYVVVARARNGIGWGPPSSSAVTSSPKTDLTASLPTALCPFPFQVQWMPGLNCMANLASWI